MEAEKQFFSQCPYIFILNTGFSFMLVAKEIQFWLCIFASQHSTLGIYKCCEPHEHRNNSWFWRSVVKQWFEILKGLL